MDSGNYSSMQSSSGGGDDQEFNSDSVSSFLNSSNLLPTSANPQSSFIPPNLTIPTSNYVQPSFPPYQYPISNPNVRVNADDIQSRGLRSDQPARASGGSIHIGNAGGSGSSDQQTTRVARNTKKRARASRRAPTTVIATDVANFKATVQQYTGMPEPPFSGSSRRLDLFGYGSGSAPSYRPANHVEPVMTSYPADSLSHYVQPILNNGPFLPIGIFPNSANMYQHPSGLSMQTQAQDMLSMQNQNQTLNSQPVLQSSLNVASFGTMSQLGNSSAAATLINQELGVSHGPHGHVNAGFSGVQSHADGSYSGNQDHQLGSFNEHYAANQAQCNNNSNLNYTTASSNVHHGNISMDNVASKGKATADQSWVYR